MSTKLIFVTGGARSGKSAFALNLANSMGKRKCYLATAQALDSEMEERIARHKTERGPDWDSIEEPLRVAERIEEAKGKYDVILFDCLTLWVSNLMHEYNVEALRAVPLPEINSLISACKTSGSTVIVVSNEVGLGIVPDNELSRNFRDIAGTANQLFAKTADEAYFVVSGIPMRLK
ncbi:MAG: adenosylcobinamide kinase [Deltaproteobacteria bacterium]|nr:adenosylcobinamide kinase [Deltaproteobacteria bacterium]